MADITITIPDAKVPVVLDAFAQQFGYDQSKLENETKAEFAKRMLISRIKAFVRDYRATQEEEALYNNLDTEIDELGLS